MPAKPRLLYGLAGLIAVSSIGLCVLDAILAGSNSPGLNANWLQSSRSS